jgi:creatinine amidohydrolase
MARKSAPPALKSRFWAELSTLDFERLRRSGQIDKVVAVLPVAAIEQHGPHLPLCVDQTLLDGVIAQALPLLPPALPVLFLPTQQVGRSEEHLRFPGTLSLGASTLAQVWMELGASVARAGVRKLLLFNSHGGQVSLMDIVARDLRSRHDLLTYSASWYSLPLASEVEGLFSAREHRFGIHGGDIETSMMLALRPQLVDMGQARDFSSSAQARAGKYPILGNGRSAKLGWQTQDYNRMGAAGNAGAATPAKGQALVAESARLLALLLQELSDLPLSTLVDGPELPR